MSARVSTPTMSGDPYNLYFGVFWIVSVIGHLGLLAFMTIATAGATSGMMPPSEIDKPIIFDLADLPKGSGVGPVAPKKSRAATVNPFQSAAKKIKEKIKESDMLKNKKKIVKSPTKKRSHNPKDAVSAKDVLRNNALERLRRKMASSTEEAGGGGTGEKSGGSIAAIYVARIRGKIKRKWRMPSGISKADLERSGWVTIRIDAAGNLVGASVTKSTGNTSVDSSLLAAVRSASPFARPPVELADNVSSGIRIPFRGSEAK